MTITEAAQEVCAFGAECDSTVYLIFNDQLVQVPPGATWQEIVAAYTQQRSYHR